MQLAIDFGNTSGKMAFFEGTELIEVIENISEETILTETDCRKPQAVIVSNVGKDRATLLSNMRKRCPVVLELNAQTRLPIRNAYATPQTLGPDRLAVAVAAAALYAASNVLVIDAGTCITYEFVSADGTYRGGGISPGIRLRYRAMHEFTAKLPLVSHTDMPDLVGDSTESCMHSGVMQGILAELKGIVAAYREKYPDVQVILCGGDAIYFETTLKPDIFAIRNLVLIGLNRILLENVA